ncbi:dihydrofolate reductase family protein [Methylocapsa sp. S129]|uniref:dihydrofolate reductase family protein n=1 Tax=Methylocapsa sp. S129 TaxID=1641869 RepID=UPI001FEF9290|nr:dihydrofolate reductase [Methylocapsa sp. S129]
MAEPPERPTGPGQRAKPYRIEGYAIISSDGMIADAASAFPTALIFDADKQYYERELDRVDAVIQGRNSYESQANSPRRRRLVLTRKIAALAPDPDHPNSFLWNPAGASLDDACVALGLAAGTLGVVGGTQVFDLFLEIGYDAFHLSRASKVKLPGGPPVFSRVGSGRSPEDVLAKAGLSPGPSQILDEAHGVTLVNWTRKAAG